MNSETMTSATSSPESGGGLFPCVRSGLNTQQESGPAPVPVSLSPPQAEGGESRTSDTCGLPSSASLNLAVPPLFLESKSPARQLSDALQERLNRTLASRPYGSMEYVATSKLHNTPSGRRLFRLVLSERRTGDHDCSGLPMAGWATPKVATGKYQYANGDKSKRVLNLEGQVDLVQLAGWSTPDTAPDAPCLGTNATKTIQGLGNQARSVLAGCSPPRVTTNGGNGNPDRSCDGQARLEDQVHGAVLTSSPAETGSRGVLNPAHSRWLQGYPVAWCQAAIRAARKLRRRGNTVSCA